MKNLINGLIENLGKGGSVKAGPYWNDSSDPLIQNGKKILKEERRKWQY
jgi:hypothetical protein